MRKFLRELLVAGTVALAGASAAQQQESTLGERLETGQMSYGAFLQLICGTGVGEAEARDLTIDDIVSVKWQDD